MNKTKKLLLFILAVVTVCSLSAVIPASEVSAASKPKKIACSMKPSMNGITVKWKKQTVSYYLIYKKEFKVKSYYAINPAPFSSYRKVKKVSGNKSSWTDRNVRQNHYYDYVVRGYKKTNGKARLVCSSYVKGSTSYQCAGLQTPELIDGGSGENFANSKNKLYLYVQCPDGVMPSGVEVFRKAKGGSGYKLVKAKKAERGRFEGGKTYVDASVQPGAAYTYKVRTYAKVNGKKKYSAYSNRITLSARNFTGQYSVKAVTPAGKTSEFVIRMVSSRYNGDLTIESGFGYDGPVYTARAGKKDYGSKPVSLESWSKDNRTWQAVPKSGITIAAGETAYLKFRFVSGSSYFGAGSGDDSTIGFRYDKASYVGSAAFGTTDLTIDLKEGKATAFPDYDN